LAHESQYRRMSGSDPDEIGRNDGECRRGTTVGRAVLDERLLLLVLELAWHLRFFTTDRAPSLVLPQLFI